MSSTSRKLRVGHLVFTLVQHALRSSVNMKTLPCVGGHIQSLPELIAPSPAAHTALTMKKRVAQQNWPPNHIAIEVNRNDSWELSERLSNPWH